MRKIRSFTLIELLIAASIFSIIILSIYSAFQTGFLSYRKVDSAFELYQTARLTLNRMELDLKNSFAYGDAEGSRFSGNNENFLEFFSVVDSYEEGEPRTDICRIEYKYELKDKKLIRTNYKGLDVLKTDIQQEGAEVASNIEKVTFEYACPTEKEGKPSFDWQDSWPVKKDEKDLTQQATLPLAVKITLSLIENAKQEEKPIEFTKVISLPLSEAAPVEGGN